MKGHLVMSAKERKRKVILDGVSEKRITLKEASISLCLSYRQTLRVYQRYLEKEDGGLIHKNRGKISNRCLSEKLRHDILNFYRERLTGFGPTFAAEKLAENGYHLHHETLRRWLIKAGLWQRPVPKKKQRQLRPRRSRFGNLIQLDGSSHAWINGEKHVLINIVDDATSISQAILAEAESTASAMKALWNWIELYGIPEFIYTDKHMIYKIPDKASLEEQLQGQPDLSAFGKACYKLGIKMIFANSPQAKGRVERSHQVYQDRFVKELAYHKISSLEEAQAFLKTTFLPHINSRFKKSPLDPKDAHRPLTPDIKLADIFVLEEQRVLTNDYTISFNTKRLQILTQKALTAPKPKDKLTVRIRLDHSMQILFKDQSLEFKPLPKPSPQPLLFQATQTHILIKHRPKPTPPSPSHPWRTKHISTPKDTPHAS